MLIFILLNNYMDSAFLFWEKYFNNQIEVSWDEFSDSFSKFIQ